MRKEKAAHADVLDFVAAYESLVARGAWVPRLHDAELPALVWIDFTKLWTVANEHGLRIAVPSILVPRLRRRPRDRFPFVAIKRMDRRTRAIEHLVYFADPFDSRGPYAPAASFVQRVEAARRAEFRKELERKAAETGGLEIDIEAEITALLSPPEIRNT